MKAPVLLASEPERIAALHRLCVLDTAPSPELDRITRLTARLLKTPVCLVSLIDTHRQWFKSSFGLAVHETPRDLSFCNHAIHDDCAFVIRDARADPRFADNPLVTDPPYVVAYAGHPIRSLEGHALGTLCVIDHVPRDFSAGDLETLHDLAAVVEQYFRDLEMRRDAQRMQQDLQQVEAQFESLFLQAGVGIGMVGLDGRWIRVNHKLCAIVGYSEVEMMTRDFQSMTHPDDLAADLQQLDALIGNRIAEYSMEKRYRHKQGHYVWVTLTAAMLRDEKQQPMFGIAVVQDIQDRKALEARVQQQQRELEFRVEQRTAELSQQKERLRLVLETATDAYVSTDGRGVITGWNLAAERMFGWTRAEALGQSIVDTIIPDTSRHNHFGRLAQFTATGQSRVLKHIMELTGRRRDGSLFPAEISLTANRFDDEWLISSFIRDITARKAADDALREARRKAEEALLAAEAANQAKTDFLATMSHEIRTPLNGVIGFNGLLLASPLNEEQCRHAELARQSGEALLHLLNDFLDFSKIEAGHLQLEPVEFDLHLEASHVLALVQEAAHEKGLELRENVNVQHRLRGDVARLRQILLNLLANAVKFTPRGHVTLCCEETLRDATMARICFQVTDTGIGIDPAVRRRLFQPFVQADVSTTRRFGGTGLGLAICKRLTEAMGGEIGVSSRLGKGSTFWVELPFEVMASPGQPLLAEPRREPPSPQQQRGRVLVVEDNPVSQLLAAEVFKRLGCLVDVVGNGQEAVEVTAKLPYDLVLMDCDMPVLNGFDATRRIRAREHGGPRLPIVAMTASALQGDAEKCLEAGMDDFMSKPLRFDLIGQIVERWMPGDGKAAG
ncbi:MAG: PAS domain S-box protein [Pseudomonadota bacterium]